MEENNDRGRFWRGVLVGALATMFAGLLVVGLALGIFLTGRIVSRQGQNGTTEKVAEGPGSQISKTDSNSDNNLGAEAGSSEASAAKLDLDMDKIGTKAQFLEQIINSYYLFDVDSDKVETGIYSGLMAGLEDPYSQYYDAEDYQNLMESTNGSYCGIGTLVSQNRETGIVTIVKVYDGTPCQEAGLQAGDVIYKVGGEEILGIDLELLINQYIRGEEGSTVDITVYRESVKDYVDLKIERRQIEVPTVEHRMMDDQVGYILVSQFDTVTTAQFKNAIDDLEKQGMKKLLLDLRNNPGGVLDAAVEMAAYILPEDKMDGMIVYTADKNGKGDKYYCKNGKIIGEKEDGKIYASYPKQDNHEVDIPIAVLVNGMSASASEAFSGCMKDYQWATLFGETTFGKGIVQNVIPLSDNSAIKLTTAHYFTPSGFDLHGKGIEPDITVEPNDALLTHLSVEPEEDNQMQEALKYLKTAKGHEKKK